jgi:hypothetical protein
MREIWLAEELLASQAGLRSMELVMTAFPANHKVWRKMRMFKNISSNKRITLIRPNKSHYFTDKEIWQFYWYSGISIVPISAIISVRFSNCIISGVCIIQPDGIVHMFMAFFRHSEMEFIRKKFRNVCS